MSHRHDQFRPALCGLEDRTVPYALTGFEWADPNVTASFMPDGSATDSSAKSNLFATLDARYPTATWQREFARALQTWSSVSNLNFTIVPESGNTTGDIRLGMYPRTDNYVGYAYYPGGGLGGDVFLNSNKTWNIGTNLDLYSVLLHETGHALGLDHSTSGTVMYQTITGVYAGLTADDVAGIQAIYGARRADSYDSGAGNNSFSTASGLNLNSSGAVSLTADLTGLGDVDYFRLTAPAGGSGSLTVTADARGLSLLHGAVSVYDSAFNLVGTAAAGSYGGVATLNLTGLTPGATYYVVADGATADALGTGAYKLTAQFGGVTPLPTVSVNNVSLAEGNGGTTLFNFTVTLSAPSSSTVTVQYGTADGTATAGSDYTAASGTLTFAPGETQKTVTVAVTGDTVAEADEAFFVNLTAPTNAVLGTAKGQGTIRNDEVAADRFEANDTAAAASNLGRISTFVQTALTLHTAGDQDFYTFTQAKNGTYTVTATPTAGSGTVHLSVLDADQRLVASGESTGGPVALTVKLVAGQRYYVLASSPSGGLLAYDLAVAKAGKGGRSGGVMADEGDLGHGTEAHPRLSAAPAGLGAGPDAGPRANRPPGRPLCGKRSCRWSRKPRPMDSRRTAPRRRRACMGSRG